MPDITIRSYVGSDDECFLTSACSSERLLWVKRNSNKKPSAPEFFYSWIRLGVCVCSTGANIIPLTTKQVCVCVCSTFVRACVFVLKFWRAAVFDRLIVCLRYCSLPWRGMKKKSYVRERLTRDDDYRDRIKRVGFRRHFPRIS